MHPMITAELAADHAAELRREADHERLAASARRARPSRPAAARWSLRTLVGAAPRHA